MAWSFLKNHRPRSKGSRAKEERSTAITAPRLEAPVSSPASDDANTRASFMYHFPSTALARKGPDLGCPACEDLSIRDLPPEGKVINTTFGHIEINAKAGCISCSMIKKACEHFGASETLVGWREIWRVDLPGDSESAWLARGEEGIPRQHIKDYYVSEPELEVQIRINPPNEASAVGYQVLVTLLGKEEVLQRSKPRSQPIELYRPRMSSPVLGNVQGSDNRWPAIGASHRVPQYSTDAYCLRRVRGWMQDCLANHPNCRGRSGKPRLPARVLCVADQTVRLIETTTLEDDYVTLSYCWGPASSQRLITTSDNVASHLDRIKWDSLSKTHRHAITLTRQLGFSYIWIDALCIIQDSPNDWATTAARMADIYENSVLTICATWSANSGGGLFSDRYAGRRDIKSSFANARSRPFRVHSDPPIYARLAFKQHFYDDSMKEAHELGVVLTPESDPLLTRAWCMQERLLSTRTLDFTLEELYWECKRVRRCECEEADRRAIQTRKMQFSQMLAGNSADPSLEHDESDAWQDIVSAYSAMSITYPKDRLPALSGLATRFYGPKRNDQSQNEYLAGIWRRDLPHSLLWYINLPPHISPGLDGEPSKPIHAFHQDYQAPSWSWAAREGQATFTKFEADSDLEVIDASCTYGADNNCGQCTGGVMTVCGRLAPAVLNYGSTRYEGSETAFKQDWQKAYWVEQDGLWTYIKPDTEIGVLGHVDYVPPKSPVYLLRMGWETLQDFPNPRASCGLVLRYLQDTDQYVRIAKFTKKDDDKKLRLTRRPKKDGSGMEDIIKLEDFFHRIERKTIQIV